MFRTGTFLLIAMLFVLGGWTVSFGGEVAEQIPPHSSPETAQPIFKKYFGPPPPPPEIVSMFGPNLQEARIYNGRVQNEYDFYKFNVNRTDDLVVVTYKLLGTPPAPPEMVVSLFDTSKTLIAYAKFPSTTNPAFMTLKHAKVPKGDVYVVVTHKPIYPKALQIANVKTNLTNDGYIVTDAKSGEAGFVLDGAPPPVLPGYEIHIYTIQNHVDLRENQDPQTPDQLKVPSKKSNQEQKQK